MSYPKDLEDYTDDQLFAEVGRRNISLRNGLCWYCNQSLRTHTCKLATPQKQPAEVEAVVDLKERLAYVRAGCAALATKPDADSSIGRSTAVYVSLLAEALEKYLETGGR